MLNVRGLSPDFDQVHLTLYPFVVDKTGTKRTWGTITCGFRYKLLEMDICRKAHQAVTNAELCIESNDSTYIVRPEI